MLLSYFSVKEPQKAKLIFNKEYFLLLYWELCCNNGVAGCPMSRYKEGGIRSFLTNPSDRVRIAFGHCACHAMC